MVVHKLESYVVKEIPGAVYSANLRHPINQELNYGIGRPTIVLDASAVASIFLSKHILHIPWQPSTLKKDIEDFVEHIISCGVNLTVVLRGNLFKDITLWFDKRRNDFEEKKKALQAFVGEGTEKNMGGINFYSQNICISTTFASIRNNHYKVFRSIDYTHKEVAEIAISQNCLAVIGQDSNYLIYEGIRNYISTKSLNIKTLDCKIYSRDKLIEHLGLKSCHLPLFATLCGNDIVSIHKLTEFHKKIKQSNRDLFVLIAQIIKCSCSSYDPYKNIENIFNLIHNPTVDRYLIKQSIDMYMNFKKTLPKNKLLDFADERKKTLDWSCTVHEVVTLREFRSGTITGFDDPNILPSSLLMRPLRQKMYGILLYNSEMPVTEYILEEMTDVTRSKFPTPAKVFPVKPVSVHPGLIQLFDCQTPNVYYLRWELFCSSISRTLKQSTVRGIPPRLLFPLLALHYLAIEVPSNFPQKIFNEKFEIEAFLVVAVLVHENIQLQNMVSSKPDLRITSQILYFLETCFTLSNLNEACGLVNSKWESCICNYFDGDLLHFVYREMNKGAKWCEFFDGNFALEVLFSALMEIIYP